MRAPAVIAVSTLLLTACAPTAKVSLLSDGNGVVGAVAVLDETTGEARDQLVSANTVAKTGRKRLVTKPQAPLKFFRLFGHISPIIEKTLYFETGDVVVAARSQQDVQDLLKVWQVKSRVSEFLIIGYTDAVGDEEDNLKLAQDRAEAVKKILVGQGFEFTPENSRVLGRGESDLVVKTQEANEENRRVVVVIR
jgi:outer membrane protein OmpA-like peptidoglycan-associated protein